MIQYIHNIYLLLFFILFCFSEFLGEEDFVAGFTKQSIFCTSLLFEIDRALFLIAFDVIADLATVFIKELLFTSVENIFTVFNV